MSLENSCNSLNRNGKIARLPAKIREEINCRFRDGAKAREIIAWLNGLTEVQDVLAREFEGKPINEVNFSEWKRGGYREWRARQAVLAEMRRVRAEAGELAETGVPSTTDSLGAWLAGQYAYATRKLMKNSGDLKSWKLLREVCHDVVALRRGDHGAEWLRIENERLKLQRKKYQAEQKKSKPEKNPPPPALSPEEVEQRYDEIFGTTPYETTSPTDNAPPESAPPPLSLSTPLGG